MESMGLAAPRRKTKYEIDPRNNAWANDDNKFGQKLMEKFGWEKGKGLGAQEDGETQNIKVKVKNDKQGIGANNDYSDTWLDHQDDFNSVLAALNTCHSAPGSGTATPTNEESTEAVAGSMEERSKSSKSRVHYKKFTQSKDLTRANASDLDALFGRRKKFEKRSKKIKKVAEAEETASPFAGMTPLGTPPARGNSPPAGDEAPSCDLPVLDSGSHDKEYDHDGNLRTVTSSLSVSDYFSKKMAEIKAKRSGDVSTAVDQFCENSCKQLKEEDGQSKEDGQEATSNETPETDKPEVYAQEKFQKASLTVQQYFELKMKEKKSKSTVAVEEVKEEENIEEVKEERECDESRDASSAECVDEGKKKKKKKKTLAPSDVENKNVMEGDVTLKKKKKKKKSEDASLPAGESECGVTSGDGIFGEAEVRKKKKKKRKLNEDDSKNVEEIVLSVKSKPELTEPPKKKKKTKTVISDIAATKTLPQSSETSLPMEENVGTEKQKKKKKSSTEDGEAIQSEPGVEGNLKQSTESDVISEKKKKKKKKIAC